MQTKTYRFVGSTCSLGNCVQLQRYGQKVELTEAEASGYVLHSGADILPDEEFSPAGHTDAELAEYSTVRLQTAAPAEFLAKRKLVWQALHTHRQALRDAEAPGAVMPDYESA